MLWTGIPERITGPRQYLPTLRGAPPRQRHICTQNKAHFLYHNRLLSVNSILINFYN